MTKLTSEHEKTKILLTSKRKHYNYHWMAVRLGQFSIHAIIHLAVIYSPPQNNCRWMYHNWTVSKATKTTRTHCSIQLLMKNAK